MPMPEQKPGRSKQDYRTPPEFLDAARHYLNIRNFAWDLAADAENTVCPDFYSLEHNAFQHAWAHTGWGWLNPPFGCIWPWAKKALESPARTAMLVPAAVGSNWWRDYVHERAHVLFLNGRLTFVGEVDAYPKDCALVLYNPEWTIKPLGYEVWTWPEA